MRSTRVAQRVAAAVASLAVVGMVGAGPVGAESSSAKPTIVEIASSDQNFSTLVTAVTAAGLVETLEGDGPFTVFAPTNAAFQKIPAAQLNAILADKAQLTDILTYHVLDDRVLAKNLKKKQSVETLQGDPVEILKKQSGATIEGANITMTDIKAKNGVIHVIDAVLVPESS